MKNKIKTKYTYINNTDIKELKAMVHGKVLNIDPEKILSGAYVSGTLTTTTKKLRVAKLNPEDVKAKIIKYVESIYSENGDTISKARKNIVKTEDLKIFIENGLTEDMIVAFYCGFNSVMDIKSDFELGALGGSIFDYELDYAPKIIDEAITNVKNGVFELAFKYPDFNWSNAGFKLSKSEIIDGKEYSWSKGTRKRKIKLETFKLKPNFIVVATKQIGYTENGEYIPYSGAEQTGKLDLQMGYLNLISKNGKYLFELAKKLLSQPEGYVKDIDWIRQGLGGGSPDDLISANVQFKNGGRVDLFEDYDNQPTEVSEILSEYDLEDNDYKVLKELQARLENEAGYTFDYGLDATPYGLRPVGVKLFELEGYDDEYAKGGEIKKYEVPYERLVDGEYENEIKTFENREDAEKFAKEHYSYVDEVSYAEGGGVGVVKKDRYGNEVKIGDAIHIRVLTGKYGQTKDYEGIVTNFDKFGNVELDGQRSVRYTADYKHNDYEHGHHIWVEKINAKDIKENLRVPKKFTPTFSSRDKVYGEDVIFTGTEIELKEFLKNKYPNSVWGQWNPLFNKGWRYNDGKYISPDKQEYDAFDFYQSVEQGQGYLNMLMIPKKYAKGGSTYAEGGEVYNAHILTNDNKLIHRRYPKKITHNEIYKEYKDKGVKIKDSQIHFAKPIDFYDRLREETKKYVRENMNDDVDSENIFITSMQKGNEYIATEIKGDTISGKAFTLTPKDLFEVGGSTYAEGGDIPKGYHKMPDKKIMANSAHYQNGGEVKYYIMDAKDGKIVSKGFDSEEKAKIEMYKIFEKTSNPEFNSKENLY
jgi:hypothetical protein